jgi:hypothetical protein
MYTNIFPLHGPPKYTQIGIFGLKRNHLATPGLGEFFANSSGHPALCSLLTLSLLDKSAFLHPLHTRMHKSAVASELSRAVI